jgi:hypothetical protein
MLIDQQNYYFKIDHITKSDQQIQYNLQENCKDIL